ncbi:MAG TPA: MFS transporter [Syntrophomonas sp.]|nr:MFS transporter [Syntrophomonas sp.]
MLQNNSVPGKGLHYGWMIVLGGFLTQVILLISIQTLPLVLAQIEETLKVTHAQAGTITSFFGLCYAGFSFLWGYLADKIGNRKTLTISGVLTSVMLILFGATVDSLSKAIFLYALVGLGCAGIYTATIPKLIGGWFAPQKRGRAMSFITAGGVLTGATLGLIVPIMSLANGWQGTFRILGIISLVVTIIILLIVRDTPAEKGLLPVGINSADEMPKEAAQEGGFGVVLKQKITWHLGIMYIFWQLAYMAGTAFLAISVSKGMNYTVAQAGIGVTIYNLFQLVGQQIWAPLSDRMERKKVIAIAGVMWAAMAFIFVATFGSSLAVTYVIIALMGIGIGSVPVILATFSDYYTAEVRGTGSGIISTLALVGRFFGPMLAGMAADKSGSLASAFIFAGVMMIIASAISLSLPNLRSKVAG